MVPIKLLETPQIASGRRLSCLNRAFQYTLSHRSIKFSVFNDRHNLSTGLPRLDTPFLVRRLIVVFCNSIRSDVILNTFSQSYLMFFQALLSQSSGIQIALIHYNTRCLIKKADILNPVVFATYNTRPEDM